MMHDTSAPSIREQFALSFSRHPDKVAVKFGHRACTFRELDRTSARLGAYLFGHLGETGVPIAIFLQDPVDAVVAITAAIRSGHSYSVLSESNPPARLNAILVDLGARLLLTDSSLLSPARSIAPAGCMVVDIADIPECPQGALNPQDRCDDRVGIYYTSGSTGEPKGVMRLHRAIVSRALAEIAEEQFRTDDIHCLTSPFSASASLMFFSAFLSGATCVTYRIDKSGFDLLKRTLLDEGITVFRSSVEPLRCFFAVLDPDDFFPDLRAVFPFGDALYGGDVEAWRRRLPPHAVVVSTLSSSEIGVMARNVTRHETRLPATRLLAGYPAMNKEILLLDDNGLAVTAGEVGEIAVRSNLPFHGYWRKPELSATKWMPDPADASRRIYRSGDLGRFHSDGQLEYMGRKDFQVKVRGFSVDLSAIENILMSHEGVYRAVAAAPLDTQGQRRLVAFVVPAKGVDLSVRPLRDLVAASLPGYMVPARIEIVSELQMGPTQKVDRASLPVRS
jgi:acyl-coenzyme A synthetase/AMP-(fatty) acid ligase